MRTIILALFIFATSVAYAARCPRKDTLKSYAQCLIDKHKLPIHAIAVQSCDNHNWCRLKYSALSCNRITKKNVIGELYGEMLYSSTRRARITSFKCVLKV